jgi:hypothetical protein
MNLCYDQKQKQFAGGDPNTVGWARLRLYGNQYISLVLGVILLISNIFLLTIPELFTLHQQTKCCTKEYIYRIFDIKSQIITFQLLISITFIVAGILDIINFVPFGFHATFVFVSYTITVYLWILVLIKWIDIVMKSSTLQMNSPMSPWLILFWVIATVIAFILATVFTVLYIIFILNIVNDTGNTLKLVLVPFTLVLSIVTIITMTILFVVGFIFFWRIRTVDKLTIQDVSFHLVKLGQTRNLLILSVVATPTLIVWIIYALQLIWSDLISLGGLFFFILLLLLSGDRLKRAYCCWKYSILK